MFTLSDGKQFPVRINIAKDSGQLRVAGPNQTYGQAPIRVWNKDYTNLELERAIGLAVIEALGDVIGQQYPQAEKQRTDYYFEDGTLTAAGYVEQAVITYLGGPKEVNGDVLSRITLPEGEHAYFRKRFHKATGRLKVRKGQRNWAANRVNLFNQFPLTLPAVKLHGDRFRPWMPQWFDPLYMTRKVWHQYVAALLTGAPILIGAGMAIVTGNVEQFRRYIVNRVLHQYGG